MDAKTPTQLIEWLRKQAALSIQDANETMHDTVREDGTIPDDAQSAIDGFKLDASNYRQAASLMADYEEVLADKRRLAREIDVALNGEEGAAKQPGLADILSQIRTMEKPEWFFRWAARAMASGDFKGAVEVIFFHPGNPYQKQNPWAEKPINSKSVVGKVRLMRSNHDEPGYRKCVCCDGPHVFCTPFDLEPYQGQGPNDGNHLDAWLTNVLPFKKLEGKRIQLTATVLED